MFLTSREATKAIAKPARASSKRIFIVSSRCSRLVCRITTCREISRVTSDIRVAGGERINAFGQRSLGDTRLDVSPDSMSIRNILSTTGAELREGGSDKTRYRRFSPC
jgi:hypothetical protein